MVAEALDIAQEFYVAITLDRSSGKDVFMVSSEGGMEIEEVAKTSPEKIVREAVTPGLGLLGFKGDDWQNLSGLVNRHAKLGMFQKLYTLYREMDASIVELIPWSSRNRGLSRVGCQDEF